MTTIHTATGTDDELGVIYFASLDGEFFIGVNRLPIDAKDAEAVAGIIEGDGNFKPLLLGKRWLEGKGGCTFDTIELPEPGEYGYEEPALHRD